MLEATAPTATYRIQFHAGFGFTAAREVVPYLRDLGITHLYASPLFKARRGSLHGYSVTNPLELNPDVGSRGSFEALVRRLHREGMGLILDIVPNHMAISAENPWWNDVLESGPASLYATFFDIDWHPPQRALEGKVLLPVLGKPFGQALEKQELVLELAENGFHIRHYDLKFPVAPKSIRSILVHRLDELEKAVGPGHPALLGLLGLITLLEHLPLRTSTKRQKLKVRHREKEILKQRLWLLHQGSPEIKRFLDANMEVFNGKTGDPRSFDLLEDLLAEQPYRLAFWRVAQEAINYRRFFSINDLIGIRVEHPEVFEATHSLLFQLIQEGKISGLRVDHVDGLLDPTGYLLRLGDRARAGEDLQSPGSRLCVFVEKILSPGEELPPEWPVCGTTGYDFLAALNGLFVEDGGLRELRATYAQFVGADDDPGEVIYEKKKLVIETLFGGEVERLTHQLSLLAEVDRYARDAPIKALRRALVEVTANLPVYRTYARGMEIRARDRAHLEVAMEKVRQRDPSLDDVALEFLRRVLLLRVSDDLTGEQAEAWLNFVMRWQQFTGPITAKGLEDTALYVYNPLVSLNEVGGRLQPTTVEAFHRFNEERARAWPLTMNATSTHDTKRGEDVRARLNVLSEIPGEWAAHLRRWNGWNRPKKLMVNGLSTPDPSQEVLLYQTLLGAWPVSPDEILKFTSRVKEYMIKAAREAKVHTHWISPNLQHEGALTRFVEAILEETGDNEFMKDFKIFEARVAYFGALNSLSQVILKVASPGVPDFYQGTELWDLGLVDPDNRRPVDLWQREQLLKRLKAGEARGVGSLVAPLLSRWEDGLIKLFVTYRALQLRRGHPELFLRGDYLPVRVVGGQEAHAVAFSRRMGGKWLVAAVGRFFAGLTSPGNPPVGEATWGDGLLLLPREAPGHWVDALTDAGVVSGEREEGPTLRLAEVFRDLPVAVLLGS